MNNYNQSTQTAVTMKKALNIVSDLESKGYQVNKIIISNAGTPVIMLFKTEHCEQLIRSGEASYQFFGNKLPIKQGLFRYQGCNIVWPESLY